MSDQDGLTPADRELESALQSLAPAAARIDPISAAFEAGQRSSRRQLRLWQSAAAAMLLVSAGAWLVPPSGSPNSTVSPRAATEFAGSSARPLQPLANQSLAVLRAAVWEHGVDGLPTVDVPETNLTPIDNRL